MIDRQTDSESERYQQTQSEHYAEGREPSHRVIRVEPHCRGSELWRQGAGPDLNRWIDKGNSSSGDSAKLKPWRL